MGWEGEWGTGGGGGGGMGRRGTAAVTVIRPSIDPISAMSRTA